MLKNLKVTVYPEDIVKTFPDPSFGIGAQITIYRATQVLLYDGNQKTVYRTWKKTVSEFLEEKQIEIGDKDIVKPSLETPLSNDIEIKITRVSETNLVEKVYLDFKTTIKEDKNLEKGKSYVAQVGQKGVKEKIFKVRRENGKEIKRVLVKERIIQKPKEQIIVYGTKIVSFGEGYATWYDWVSGPKAAHKSLPLGTKVRVVNTQNGKSTVVTIVDRGPFKGAIIDLSKEAFAEIGNLGAGKIWVRLEKAE